MQGVNLGGDPGKHHRRVGSEAGKGRQPVQGVFLSRALVWATGVPFNGGPLGGSREYIPYILQSSHPWWGSWAIYPPVPISHS